MLKYVALFEYVDGEEGFGVVFPDLPGCVSAGNTYENAYRNAHEALAMYAEECKELPKPRTLEQIKAEWRDWPEWEKDYKFLVGMVGLVPASQPKKYTLYLDAALMARIDEVSKNRSAFLSEAAKAALESDLCKRFISAE